MDDPITLFSQMCAQHLFKSLHGNKRLKKLVDSIRLILTNIAMMIQIE